jgi:hypothetical protein
MSALIAFFLSTRERPEKPGQAMVEYSLVILLVVIFCIVVITQLGDVIKNELYGAVETLTEVG